MFAPQSRSLSLERVLAEANYLTGNDRDFFKRVWSTEPEVYAGRVRACGFSALGDVLDAGCGFGQWTLSLAHGNRSVIGLEMSRTRVRLVADIVSALQLSNVSVTHASIEAIPLPDRSLDGIFAYSVLYFTDFRVSLREFARILRPGGRLYVCTNGLGWYLHNLLNGHNPSTSFDPRAMAIAALENTVSYFSRGIREMGKQIVNPSDVLAEEILRSGFTIDGIGPEGTVTAPGEKRGNSFYPASYFGVEGVYEILARRNS
jgi:SAM-dependent methyltransferase